MARYHGKSGVVYMSSTGAGVAAALTVSEFSLDMATDKVDVTSMGDANKTYVQGLRDVSGSISAFWDDTQDTLFDGSESADGVKLYLYPSSTAPTFYFYGPAFLDASLATSATSAITVSGNFAASGAWGRKP